MMKDADMEFYLTMMERQHMKDNSKRVYQMERVVPMTFLEIKLKGNSLMDLIEIFFPNEYKY